MLGGYASCVLLRACEIEKTHLATVEAVHVKYGALCLCWAYVAVGTVASCSRQRRRANKFFVAVRFGRREFFLFLGKKKVENVKKRPLRKHRSRSTRLERAWQKKTPI